MSFSLTERAINASEKLAKQPNIVLVIDGVDTKYGSAEILKVIRVGDPNLYIDDTWVIGGFRAIEDQLSALSLDSSTTSIKQQLDIDKGRGSSVSSMEIGLIDFSEQISRLISPGLIVSDILGRRAQVYLGFAEDTSFPEDYIVIFRGIIDDIKSEAGLIKLNIAHPDQKKRQLIYYGAKANCTGKAVTLTIASPCVVSDSGHSFNADDTIQLTTSGALPTGLNTGTTYYIRNPIAGVSYELSTSAGGPSINTSGAQSGTHRRSVSKFDTTIDVQDTSGFLLRTSGPDGVPDTSFSSYIRIDDEIISYTGLTGTSFTGCTRGSLGTTIATHSYSAKSDSFYRLTGNVCDLAMKVMLSGWQDNFVENVECTHFNVLGDLTAATNTIFFNGRNLETELGITIGDYLDTSGASNGANNVTNKEILNVVVDDYGTYLEVNNVTFVTETDTAAVVAFRSQYDSLPSGLKMSPDEVDIAEHLRLQRLFLSSYEYDFYLKETIENASEWIEQQLYKPAGAYSLPRKARSSIGYFIGPLPSSSTITLNDENVTNANKLKLRRTINKNFFNTIVYKYEIDPLEDKFLRGVITQSATSLTQIPVGAKALIVEATGFRDDLLGGARSVAASNRRLDRFKFGSEFLEGVNITYEYGFNLEIGDIIVFDASNLAVTDTSTGERGKPSKLFEIVNKSMSIRTGNVVLDLLDTGFDGAARYCLIAPSSKIKSGISTTKFVIESYYNSPYGVNEYKKWERYPLCRVKIVSPDFTTRYAQTHITNISGNTITVAAPLGFTPQAGDMMTLSQYDFAGVTDQIKLLYGHAHNTPTFTNGDDLYQML